MLPKAPSLTRLSPSVQAQEKSKEKEKETKSAKMNRSNEPRQPVPVRIIPVMDERGHGRPWGRDPFLQHVAPSTGNLPATPPALHTAHLQRRHLGDANLLKVLNVRREIQ